MGKQELDNLVRIQKLKVEAASQREFAGMLKSARTRLTDSQNESLDPDSRFDLAYGAAHRLALAALRYQGYRSEDRITVFQTPQDPDGVSDAERNLLRKSVRDLLANIWPADQALENSGSTQAIATLWPAMARQGLASLGSNAARSCRNQWRTSESDH